VGSDRVSRARPYSGTRLGSPSRFRLQGSYLLWREFPPTSTSAWFCNSPTRRQTDQDGPTTPTRQRLPPITSRRFGLFPFRSPLLRESRFPSFPRATKMFQFTRLPRVPYGFRHAHARITTRRFPHSDIPGSMDSQLLTRAFRSRSRPSSAPGAKASTVCPLSLDHEEHRVCRYGVFKVRAGGSRRRERRPRPVSQNSTA
jgi:hypothetical protein